MEELEKSDILSIFNMYFQRNEVPEIWNEIKDQWRVLQWNAPLGRRICPVCGKLFRKFFTKHLESHGISREEYVMMLYKLDDIPVCANPNCNNKVTLKTTDKYSFHEYCSRKCAANHHVELGTFHLLHQNLKLDSEGKSIIHINSNNSRLSNNSHPWQHKNLKLDSRGCSINHSNSNDTRIVQGNHYCQQRDNKLISGLWHSSGELYILNVIKELGFNIITNKVIPNKVSNNSAVYYPDGYIEELNLCIECDGFSIKKDSQGNYLDYYKQKYLDYSKMGYQVLILQSDSLEIAMNEVADKELLVNMINSYKNAS